MSPSYHPDGWRFELSDFNICAGQIKMAGKVLCLLLVLVAAVSAQNDTAANGPIAFAPTKGVALAPAPQTLRVRTGQYASDSLATTPTSLYQIQVLLHAHTALPAITLLPSTPV